LKPHLRGHSHGLPPLPIRRPFLRQIQPTGHRRGNLAITDDDFHTDLATGGLAHRTAILMRYSNRMLSLLEPARLINDPSRQRLHHRHHFPPNGPPHLLLIPRTVGDELLQLLAVSSQPLGQGLYGFPLPGHQQALHVKGGARATFASPKLRHKGFEKFRKLVYAALPKLFIPLHKGIVPEKKAVSTLNRVILALAHASPCSNREVPKI